MRSNPSRSQPSSRRAGALRLVLGDQLGPELAGLADLDPACDVVLMAEVAEEATYVPHHRKKIAFVLAAMRHFAAELALRGLRVRYVTLDDPANSQSLEGEVRRAVRELRPSRVVLTEPGEHRLLAAMRGWDKGLGVPLEIREDTRFLCSHAEFDAFALGRRQLRMEPFYRLMRRRHGILVDGAGEPEGGRWNFDALNRRTPPAGTLFPGPLRFEPDAVTRAVIELVRARFPDRFGDLEPFWFAVTRNQAEAALAHFVHRALPQFGDYQDAMRDGEDYLFHAALSQYLNAGLLDPRGVLDAAVAAWRAGWAPLNAVEGFVRQILGWREYVRGIYWRNMPAYRELNRLGAEAPLPAFYWTGRTAMRCMARVIDQTRREALSHHIQRLMVTGNFALLAGLRPDEVHVWYLAVYADAYEWVELPNTLGMALHADGGLMASKPYAASGAYINRMSDFCRQCRYDVKKRTGPDACPFNHLYWNFMITHRDRLAGHPRLAQAYRTLDRLGPEERARIEASAGSFLASLEPWEAADAG